MKKILNHHISAEKIDWTLLFVTLMLIVFGLIMIYSATISGREMMVVKNAEGISNALPFHYFKRQLQAFIISALACFVIFQIPTSFLRKNVPLLLFAVIFLLLITPFIGKNIGGARRWISIFGFQLQTSELFKIVCILYIASAISRRPKIVQSFKDLPWIAFFPMIGILLTYLTTDLGSCVVVGTVFIGMLLLSGLSWKWIVLSIASSVALITLAIHSEEYRMARWNAFLSLLTFKDFFQYAKNTNYQVINALQAIINGSWFGVGLGNSLERYYIPAMHTDFMLAIIGEELGVVGIIALIFVYIWLCIRAFSIGHKAQQNNKTFSSLTAFGIGILITIQSFFHIGVNLGILPTKGLTLPFISYGGSSLLVTMIAITILLRIDYENRRQMRGFKV